MLKGPFRVLSIALMITVILVPTFIVFVSSSTGLIRVNNKTASSQGQTVEAGGDINLYFGDVTWSGTQLYLLMSQDSNPQASTGDVFYTPAILVEDVTGTNSHSYSNGMGNWVVGNQWINGSIAPNIPVGAYKIKAFDSLGEDTAITDVFITVNMQVSQATLQISPLGGPGGIEVTLTGTGYGAYSLVTMSYYDSEVDSWMFLGTTSANGAGQITFTTEVPDLRKAQRMGDYSETYTQISFRAEVGGIVYSYADYNQYARGIKQIGTHIASGLYGNGTDLSSTLTVEPGDSVTISGKWFHPGVVYIRWDGNVIVGTVTSTQWSSAVIVGNSVADQTGYFQTTITIPTSSAGDHYIAIEDSESRVLIKVFMHRGSLAISPATGPGGISATFSGSGYPASTPITIEYYDSTLASWNFLGTATSNSAGQITFTSEIPDLRRTVWSGDCGQTTNTLSFRTQSSGLFYSYADYSQYARGVKRIENQIANGLFGNGTDLSSTITVEPEDEIIIAGEWFHPGVVYVRWDGTQVVGTVTSSEWAQATIIGTGVASQTGYFELTATIPTADSGVHYISVEDSETFVILKIYMDNGAEGEHELTVESLPTSGVTFKIDDDSEETTYSEDVDSGSYVIEMPESQVVNGSIYIFDRWTDGNLNRIRSVNVNSDTQLTAVFLAAAVAKFSYSPSDPAVGEEITFDASESFDLDGSIQSYAWDFGDGTQQTTTSNPVISHTYYLPNTYPVELTVIDDGSMGSSVTQNVSAKIPTTVSISTSSSSTSIGFQVQISGTLLDDYGMGVADETVVLEYAFEGTSTWTPFTSDQTDANGDYSRVWIPPATGYFTIKAEWAGNATHIGASSTTTINSIEYDGEYVFSVESNSTISALSFNSTENALSFNAQGVTGTQGYAKVIIAKTLVVNPAEILVLLDGNQIQYTLEETLESWIITIRYSHSTHKITVALDTSVIPEFSSVILLSLAISASMVMVAVYRKKLNKK